MVPGADVGGEVGERLAVAKQLVLSMPGPSQTVSPRAAMVRAGTPLPMEMVLTQVVQTPTVPEESSGDPSKCLP